MANCLNCGEEVHHINSPQLYCDDKCRQEWRNANREGSFSEGWGELPEVTENRQARNAIFKRLKPLACAGNKEARQVLRQTMKLTAIWDDKNMKEVRL